MVGLRRELLFTLGGMCMLNLLLSFGAIGLLTRMGPALERIVQQNVYSVTAAEDVLANLAIGEPGAPMLPESKTRIVDALGRMRANVTEPEEPQLIDRMQARVESAAAGDPEARRVLLVDSHRLAGINRQAMERTATEARRLGRAGAWAGVLVGFLTFGLSIIAAVRLRRRVLWPLLELYTVLDRVRRGGRLRRCKKQDAPLEISRVMQAVNELLDERGTMIRGSPGGTIDLERAALLALLESNDSAVTVMDAHGNIVRANHRALDLLASSGGRALREALARVADEKEAAAFGIHPTRLEDSGGWVCVFGREAPVAR